MSRLISALLATFSAAILVSFAIQDTSSAQLLINPGFEDGATGWNSIDAEIYPSNRARNGAGALEVVTPADPTTVDVYQWLPVQPGAVYEFSGWVYLDDFNAERVFLLVSWFTAGNDLIATDDSPWITGNLAEWRSVTTGGSLSPANAATARVSVTVAALGPSSVFLDDFSLDGPAPDTPTPSEGPGSPTPAATTAAPATSTLLPSTTTPTGSPSTTPTSAPGSPTAGITSGPTATPVNSTTSPAPTSPPVTRTATPAATPTVRPSPPPITPLPTPDEPQVFGALTNGGFEAVREDGTPYGWRKIGGTITTVSAPVAGGMRALALTSSGSGSTKWAYQTITVVGGQHYEASAEVWKDDSGVAGAFLRISWYTSVDGSGEAISTVDSTATLGDDVPTFRVVSTGPVQAPADAGSARVRLMLRPLGDGPAKVVFDNARFVISEPAGPTTTPSVSATAPATETARPTDPATPPGITPTPVPTAPPTPSHTPFPTPAPTVAPTPAPEPRSFQVLTNGGFELAREDETPYGWHKIGGEMTLADRYRIEGDLSVSLSSASTSTKWVYQAVAIQPTAHYRASAWVLTGDGSETEIRVSWYASEDGSGSAIATEQSEPLAGSSSDFRFMEMGAVQAPAEARSARVRLVLRPDSSAQITAYFDGVSLEQTQPRSLDAPVAGNSVPDRPTRGVLGALSSPNANVDPGSAVDSGASGPPAPRPLVRPLNVRPATTGAREATAEAPPGDGDSDWLLAAMIIGPSLGIAGILGFDASQRRRLGG